MDTSDLLDQFRQLTATQIRARIRQLDADRAALMTLLRSVLARERAAMRRIPRPEKLARG
jgi:hypothetical protein